MEHSANKSKPRRRSYSGTVNANHGPETPRRAIGRSLTKENSLKTSYNAKSDNSSRIYPDDMSRQSRARRNSFDTSELSGVVNSADTNKSCCNMKLSDLTNENYRNNVYNSFEASIIEERKGNRARHPGRSPASIRKNPSAMTLSLAGLTKMTSSISQFRAMTMITDNILLGGREDAENAAQLLEYGVTHVLNTAQQLPNYFPQHFVYFKVGLIDATNANVVEVMESVVSFLSHVERVQGRVLLHCLAGVSRSVSVLLMHLMVRHRLSLQHSFRYVRSCRPQVNPNEAFKLQLARLEVQELRCSSVAKDADKMWDFYEWNLVKRTMPTTRVHDDGVDNDGDSSLYQQNLQQQQEEEDRERERRIDADPSFDADCCTIC